MYNLTIGVKRDRHNFYFERISNDLGAGLIDDVAIVLSV